MIGSAHGDLADLQAWRAAAAAAAAAGADRNEYRNESDDEDVIDLDTAVESTKIRNPSPTSQPLLGFNVLALQRYILMCAQNMSGGGLRDKPGKA